MGAYERDNFGDLLFLLLSEHYLAGHAVLASAPFATDIASLVGRPVPSYAEALGDETFDAVWTVGGEVGGVTEASAFEMSASAADYDHYVGLPPAERPRFALNHMHCPARTSPYVPDLGLFPGGSETRQYVNSVGLSGIQDLSGRERQRLLRTLSGADVVSVRDELSSRALRKFQVRHTLAPDLVHTLSLIRPLAPTDQAPALVQASAGFLAEVGVEAFADALVTSPALGPLEVRLLPAGTARFHDSIELYGEVVERVRRRAPDRRISISQARGALERADEVGRCAVWIGTSLHGRIVAATYDRPRVSLENPKVTGYASTWDAQMPFDVQVDGLDDAVVAALSPSLRAGTLAATADLSRQADANIRNIVADLELSDLTRHSDRMVRNARTMLPFASDLARRKIKAAHAARTQARRARRWSSPF